MEGIRSDLVETLYAEGIHSAQAFKEWTEKELLALKGIGPATVKKIGRKWRKLEKNSHLLVA
ncbi:cytoplasmic protein [Streptococcus dysgalactiae]|nr:cytoplasmic protein [Streptococcus dysgalactiae]